MKIPYFCCIGAELKRYAKDFDFMNQVYLYKVPVDDTIEEVLAQDYFQAISDTVLQDDLVYIYEASAETLHSCRFDKQNGHITAVPLASDETLTGAVTTIIHDNLTKNRAVISNNDGKIAASEVTTTELGYLSGATSNIQEQLNEKAKTDLSNLTSTGANIANWSSNVSNCITEIPQDIKLEIDDSNNFIIKSGSKVYYGDGTYDVLDSDKSYAATTVWPNADFFFCIKKSDKTLVQTSFSGARSSATNPGVSYIIWFNTTDGKCYWNDGNADAFECSMPVALVAHTNNVGWTGIKNAFNGFGFMSSIVFVLPGVKGLIPNGRNADGTLKNIIVTTSSVNTVTTTSSDDKCITLNNIGQLLVHNGDYETETQPSTNYAYWYRPSENTAYDTGTGTPAKIYELSAISIVADGGGKILSLASKTAFHAVDYSDTEYIAHQAMPSDRYINLTLGASGSTYTAPADGYFLLYAQYDSGSNTAFDMYSTDGTALGSRHWFGTSDVQAAGRITVPARKNQTFMVTINGSLKDIDFKFVYANGAK